MSRFLSASNVFLIAILLDPALLIVLTSGRTGPLGGTFPVLFQLKRFLIYSNQFLRMPLYVITPEF